MDGTLPPLRDIIALKRRYGFRIYVDEAHSFLSIGRTGRGVVEHLCDDATASNGDVTMEDIDMLGGTISKSLSSVGGFVLCSESLTEHIEARAAAMRASGGSSIPTLSLIRTLQILRKPALISRRLAHLRSVSIYVAEILEAKGYQISTTRGAPLIAIILDTLNRVLEFVRVGRTVGLICGAAYSAAPRGAPRVRLSLTSAHTWADVDEMLRLIDKIAMLVGVKGLKMPNDTSSLKLSLGKEAFDSNVPSPLDEVHPAELSDAVDASILTICPPRDNGHSPESLAIRAAGVSAFSRYNLGASGPRWMYGTFAAHLSLEELLNSTVESIMPSAMHREKVPGQIKTTLFTDTRVGIMSVIATAMEGSARRRARKGERHLVLLPKSAGLEVREAAASIRRDQSICTQWFEVPDEENIEGDHVSLKNVLFRECGSSAEKMHITMYLDTDLLANEAVSSDSGSLGSKLAQIFAPLSAIRSLSWSHRPLSTIIILSDADIFISNFSSTRVITSTLGRAFPELFCPSASLSSPSISFLLGSFHTLPQVPGLQGAFCTGSKHLVEKVQLLGQGVMYTAMMPPLAAALAEESIKTMLER